MRTTSPGFRYLRRIEADADAGRRAGGDDVARLQRDAGGERLDDGRNVEDQQRSIGVLAQLAVDAAADRRVGQMSISSARHRPGAHRAEGVLRLADQPLAVAALQVAGGHVVDDGVAPDVVEGVLRCEMPRPPLPMMTASSAS